MERTAKPRFGVVSPTPSLVRPHMKFLIDTNVLIPLEPAGSDLAPTMPVAAELLALISAGGHQVLLHPAHRADLARDADRDRRLRTEALAKKYAVLEHAPVISVALAAVLGMPEPKGNDWVDNQLLAALQADAVDYVVTEDIGVHHKARRLGLETRVATIAEAAEILRGLFDIVPTPPPAVHHLKAAELAGEDPIFASIRDEYGDGFDAWFRMCRLEGRDCWVIEGPEGGYAAVCIIKTETSAFGLVGRILKLCTFKVSDRHRGRHYGELLLKTAFDHRLENGYDAIYLTVFEERHPTLRNLLEDFGFDRLAETPNGETVVGKSFLPTSTGVRELDALAFHVQYGPPAIKSLGAETYLVPIVPEYHAALFPDAELRLMAALQLSLGIGPRDQPFGNALRKAYLSHALRPNLNPGATLLFYRSHDLRAVTCVGVLEVSQMSSEPDEIARMVGKRTLYSYEDIEWMCRWGKILVLLFRQDRILDEPVTLDELVHNGVVGGPPQTVTRVRKEGLTWLAHRIGV